MLVASTMAGFAFSQTRLGNVHAMSHPVGGHYGVAHGIANSILLTRIMRNSPAQDAGLLAGDVVIRVDDSNIRETGDISDALRGKWGETVPVTVIRKGERVEIRVVLEEE